MRISTDYTSEFYNPYCMDVECITVAGKEVIRVIEFDTDFGWVRVAEVDSNGSLLVDGDKWKTKKIYGRVVVKMRKQVPENWKTLTGKHS